MRNKVKPGHSKTIVWHWKNLMLGKHLDALYSPCFWIVKSADFPKEDEEIYYSLAVVFSVWTYWFVIGLKKEKNVYWKAN